MRRNGATTTESFSYEWTHRPNRHDARILGQLRSGFRQPEGQKEEGDQKEGREEKSSQESEYQKEGREKIGREKESGKEKGRQKEVVEIVSDDRLLA